MGEGITALLTPSPFPSPSSQKPPRESGLPSSSLLLTATRTGESEGGSGDGDVATKPEREGLQPIWKIPRKRTDSIGGSLFSSTDPVSFLSSSQFHFREGD